MKKYNSILLAALLIAGLFSAYAWKHHETVRLKIMSYNIRHGEGMDNVLDLSRSANIIKAQAPDICALQEVDHFCLRTERVGQTAYLSEQTGMTGTFGKFMDFQNGEYGMATLSAKPLVSTKILPLPDGKYEPRSSIVHEIQIAEACTIAFANVHFDWIGDEEGSANRLKQAEALVKYLDALNRAAIITGDFNCTPDSPAMQYFTAKGFVFADKGDDNLSFQGENKADIDHLIYRNAGSVKIKVKSARLLDVPVVSDHRPLVAELEVTF